jgi:hypothetical protein
MRSKVVSTLLLTGLFVADLVTFSADVGIRAPWSGLLVAAMVGRYWGIGLAVLATTVVLLALDSAGSEPSRDCARECGIPTLAVWALVVPMAALFATVGALAGQVWRGRRL